MAFSEQLKSKIRRRTNFRCCMCHKLDVQIHHIIPQAERGEDTEDNAAPLCPSCHDTYGANPQKRKLIREMRDDWYEKCEKEVESSDAIKGISERLQNLASKEDVERLAVRSKSYVLGASETTDRNSIDNGRYSFVRQEFIHPLIIRELLGWISDRRETTVSIDISSANQSNRFYGEFNVNDRNGRSWVEWVGSGREFFMYSHVATSPSGVEMVECYDCSGGSGVFGSVGLFSFERDRALGKDEEGKLNTRERYILKILGSIALGDRYGGEISYVDGFLMIGSDNGWFNRGQEAARQLPIR